MDENRPKRGAEPPARGAPPRLQLHSVKNFVISSLDEVCSLITGKRPKSREAPSPTRCRENTMTERKFQNELNLSMREAPHFVVRFNDALLSEFGDANDDIGWVTCRIAESLMNDIETDMWKFNDANPFGSDPYYREWDNIAVEFDVICIWQGWTDEETGEEHEADMHMPSYIGDCIESALDKLIAEGKLAYPA